MQHTYLANTNRETPEAWGPRIWRQLRDTVESVPCPDCRKHGHRLLSAWHDLVNVQTGKPLHDPENFKSVVREYNRALEKSLNNWIIAAQNHLSRKSIAVDVSGDGDFIRERLRHPEVCDPDSFRTRNQGDHKLVLCCPRGSWDGHSCDVSQVRQSRLHPVSEEDALLREAMRRSIPVIDGDAASVDNSDNSDNIYEDALKNQLQSMVRHILTDS